MPGLNKLVEKYKDNPDIVFVAIACDKKERVDRFLQGRVFNYIQTLSNDNALALFGDGYPVHLIINPEGQICYYHRGGFELHYISIEQELKKL